MPVNLKILVLAWANLTLYTPTYAEQLNQPLTASEMSQLELPAQRLVNHLHQLNQKHVYTPKIKELKNPYQVRSLFIASVHSPFTDIQFSFNAGAAYDEMIGKGLYGLANMTARLMLEGTSRYNAEQLTEQFVRLGSQLSITADHDMFIIRLRTPSNPIQRQQAIDLVLHLIEDAQFAPKHIANTVKNASIGQKLLQERPQRLMELHFQRAIYTNHPYGNPITGTQNSLKKFNQAHLLAFRNQFLVRENLNIAITAVMKTHEAEDLAGYIAKRIRSGKKSTQIRPILEQLSFNIHHIAYPSTQAYILIGHLGLDQHHPDRFALDVANQILGGHGFHSKLMQALRINRGLSYAVTSQVNFPQSRGLFQIKYSTQHEQVLESIDVVHQTLLKFKYQPLSPELLEQSKVALIRAYPLRFASQASMNNELATIGFKQYSSDEPNRYLDRIAALQLADVERVIQQHIHPDRLTIVVVSPELDRIQLRKILQHNLRTFNVAPSPYFEQEDEVLPRLPIGKSALASDTDTFQSVQLGSNAQQLPAFLDDYTE